MGQKKVALFAALGTVVLLGGITMVTVSSAEQGGSASVEAPRERAENVGGLRSASSSKGWKSGPSGDSSFPRNGLPQSALVSYEATYRYVRRCEARRQFEDFFENQRIDPNSVRSKPEKLMQLDPDVRARYLERVAMLEERREECAGWEREATREQASQQIYLSALENALAGDRMAAACFVVAPWAVPDESSPAFQRLSEIYSTNAPALVESGIELGSWPMVRAAASALNSEAGMTSRLSLGAQKAYEISRLMQLGSEDAAMSQTFGYDAARYGAQISDPAILKRLDEDAGRKFQSQFHRTYSESISFTKLCD